MIQSISIQGYKSLKDIDITLNPFTIFVGPNGSGKTTTLSALLLLHTLIKNIAQSPNTRDATIASFKKTWDAFLTRPSSKNLFLSQTTNNEEFSIKIEGTSFQPTVKINPSTKKPNIFNNLQWAQLQSQLLSAPSPGSAIRPTLSPSGWNLPTVLNYAHSRRDGSLEAIEEDMASLIPGFKRIYLEPTTIDHTIEEIDGLIFYKKFNTSGFRMEIEFEHIGRIPAEHVSEGTLLALGLLTLIHTEPAQVILMDDVERGLHPAAQQQLIRLLRKVQERHQLQLILSTHSPFVVDLCEPEEVRVFGRDAQGYTAARPLTDHKDAQKWRKLMRTGEFWSVVGEDWVIGERG